MNEFPEIGPGWTLFLDRDGVINKRLFDSYVLDWSAFEFTPGLLKVAAKIGKAFDKIIVVTNQQCVAKGLLKQEELDSIHHQMLEALQEAGMEIDLVLAATEFKNGTAQRRKPNIQMGLEAKELFPSIDFSRSIMIGDTNTDILFGKRLGMFTILVESEERVKEVPDLRLPHLAHLGTYL
jgi:D-glycero-D-manno-heptose 1,7-bisphosphate phosphatase/D-glycero-alpha-D-manno-heptose 1-phosphate guanylyltransferase